MKTVTRKIAFESRILGLWRYGFLKSNICHFYLDQLWCGITFSYRDRTVFRCHKTCKQDAYSNYLFISLRSSFIYPLCSRIYFLKPIL
ncbi:unnamed protein product [Calypogeia fissa]